MSHPLLIPSVISNMSHIFNGDSQMEVITVLANCGTDIGRARQALTKYIVRKQDKGRSTDHILSKLRRLELKFINDTSLHPAFRDARAFTCLPRSPDLPLPDFVRKRNKRDGLVSRSELTISTSPATLSTSKSCSQLHPPVSPVASTSSSMMEEIHGSLRSLSLYETRPPSFPPANTSSPATYLPYMHASTSTRSRSFTLPPSMPSPLIPTISPKRIRYSYGSPPPTSPLPDIPIDVPDEHDAPIPGLHLLPPDRRRHISWSSQSSSSSLSSYPSPRTPLNAPYTGLTSKPTVIIRGGDSDYLSRRESTASGRPPVVAELSETDIPSILLSERESATRTSSESDLPVAYRDSPILGERPVSRSFGYPLDNALRLCGASLVVRREVSRCIQQDRGYERHTWLTVLHECGIAEEDIPTLLHEMAAEAGFA